MYHPSRGGVRGGRDQFNWDDIKGDKHRENYLGHSIKAPVGRWQKGKDLHWYTRDKHADEEAAARDEIRRLKEEEEEAMQEMLGLAPIKARRQLGQLDAREVSEVLKKVKDGEESTPSYAAGERVEGLGFAPVRGQITHGQPGRGQVGPENSEKVSYEKVPAVTTEQRIEEFSGNEVKRDATHDHLVLVEAQVATRPESMDKTSSSSSVEEGVSARKTSRKRKSEKRREEKRTLHKTRKKSKSRESEHDVKSHGRHEERRESRRKAMRSSEEPEGNGGYTGRRHSGHIKDLSRKEYFSKEISGSEGSEGNPEETTKKTSAIPNPHLRRGFRSHHDRSGKLRHDSDSDEEAERRRGSIHIKDQFRKDHFSRDRHDGSFNARHDRERREGNFQSMARLTSSVPSSQLRRESRPHHNSNGRLRHDSDSDQEQEKTTGCRQINDQSGKDHVSKDGHDVSFNAGHYREGSEGSLQGTTRRAFAQPSSQLKREFRSHHGRHSDHDKESEGRRGDVRQMRQDSVNDRKREDRRGDNRQRRHDSGSDKEKEGIKGDRPQSSHDGDSDKGGSVDALHRRHYGDSDKGRQGRSSIARQRMHDSRIYEGCDRKNSCLFVRPSAGGGQKV